MLWGLGSFSVRLEVLWIIFLIISLSLIFFSVLHVTREMEEERVPLVHVHCNSRPSTWWVPPVTDRPEVKIQGSTRDDLSR